MNSSDNAGPRPGFAGSPEAAWQPEELLSHLPSLAPSLGTDPQCNPATLPACLGPLSIFPQSGIPPN